MALPSTSAATGQARTAPRHEAHASCRPACRPPRASGSSTALVLVTVLVTVMGTRERRELRREPSGTLERRQAHEPRRRRASCRNAERITGRQHRRVPCRRRLAPRHEVMSSVFIVSAAMACQDEPIAGHSNNYESLANKTIQWARRIPTSTVRVVSSTSTVGASRARRRS